VPRSINTVVLLSPLPRRKAGLYATALSFCLLMLIMQIILSFVCRQRVFVGQWPDWPSAGGPDVSFQGKKLQPREISASDGGLLVAPVNAPHLLKYRDERVGS